jgi:hypothetical protein
MKFSRAISRVKWLSSEKTYVSKTISVLVLRVSRDSPRELHHTQSPGKQQISFQVTGGLIKLYNFHNLYFSPNSFRMIKSRRMI